MKKKQIALWILLAIVGIAMLAGVISILVPTRYIDYRVTSTISSLGIYALGGLIISTTVGKMRVTFRFCVGAVLLSMLIFVGMIWFEDFFGWIWQDRIMKVAAVSLLIGVTLSHRLLVCPLRAPIFIAKVAKRSALISGMLICTIGSVGLLSDGFGRWDDLVYRLLMIFAIVAAGSTFACGALALFGPKPGDDEPGLLASSMPVSMTCPRCRSAVEAQSNKDARCPSCRLKIRVEIEEPRCSCGYLLYELESDICPECGKPIDQEDRWSARPALGDGHAPAGAEGL